MSKWLDAARARDGLKASEMPDKRDISDRRIIGPIAVEPIVANVSIVPPAAGASTKQDPVRALPPLVQAVLDQWQGAEIVAVRRGINRDFKPLTYAEASAQVTASLPPPKQMTKRWARMMWLRDFGPTKFY